MPLIASKILGFYRVAKAGARVADQAAYARLYRHFSTLVFLSVTFGYMVYYTARMSLFVTKKPLLDSGLVDAADLGRIGFGLLAAYGVGKTVNGFLGDHVHLARFFITGLLLSGVSNICFGLSGSYTVFLLMWLLNGWFQSVGATTSGVALTSWFSSRGLGTRFSVWSISHNVGEWLSFVGTAALVNHSGWRWGFWGPALLCLATALLLTRTMPDRPRSLGLDPPHGTAELAPAKAIAEENSVASKQWEAARNPLVWLIGLASAFMYVSRYALNSWGMLYLQTAHGYSLIEAGGAVSLVSFVGLAGTLSSGPLSDYLFSARRGPVCLFYGTMLVLAMCAVLLLPEKHPWLMRAALGLAGFAIGGQLLFLGGLAAAELCSRRAAGAALGIVGGLSYAGAAVQDYVSGRLIQTGSLFVGHYDFHHVKIFWIGSAVFSLLLCLPLLSRSTKHPDHR